MLDAGPFIESNHNATAGIKHHLVALYSYRESRTQKHLWYGYPWWGSRAQEQKTTKHRNRMSEKSDIEWTDATWNAIRGCDKVSPGCKNCYAQTFAERWRGIPGHAFEQGFDLRLVPEHLDDPVKWGKPRKIFVNSMSDLFHEGVPDAYIERVCRVMLAANWHTYQVLTKRPDRMAALLRGKLKEAAKAPHILWGVSVEDRKHGVPRIAKLRKAQATNMFLSIEPLLEDLGEIDLSGISWVIVGGESGPRSRPIAADWVRSIRRQCRAAKVPFFFKQWGGTQKKKAGKVLDNRIYNEFPIIEAGPVPSQAVRRRLLEEILSA
jgi:protein gp37